MPSVEVESSIFSCSAEVNNTGVRVGWSNGVETVASGCSIQNFQTERCATSLDLYNCIGCVIAGNILTGGDGTPGPTHGRISSMTWAAGSPPLVTVTTTGNHNIAGNPYQAANSDGTYTLQLEVGGGGSDGLNPLAYCPPATQADGSFSIRATVTGATTFTYPGVTSNPGSFVQGSWNYPLRYAIRCRIVKETLISGNQIPIALAFGTVDLDYAGAAQHRNNVFTGLHASFGWILPTVTKNLAGWKFIGCSGTVPSYGNAANPFGAMKFGDLPGQFSDPSHLYQDGPLESQEYDIIDSPRAASGNFAANVTVGGGTNHVKVRYDGTNWKISG